MVHERIDPYIDENVMLLSRLAHIKRYKKATKFANRGDLILDAGCGYGYGSRELVLHKVRVIGVDKSSHAIEYASKRYNDKVQYFLGDLEDFDLSQFGLFDLITFFEVIEHLNNPEVVVRNFRNHIRPKGHLLMSTPNGRNAPENNPHHIRRYRQSDIKDLLDQNGFEVKKVLGQYPLIGSLSELLRKATGYSSNTDTESSLLSRFVDLIPLVPETFSEMYEGRIATATCRTLYFIAQPKE